MCSASWDGGGMQSGRDGLSRLLRIQLGSDHICLRDVLRTAGVV